MPKPNLLLCFDAFGTLFKPKGSVAQQYAEIARQCGMANITEKELQPHLGAALKAEMKQNPNYGKATGLGATRWWTNVIENAFTPMIPKGQNLPRDLAPKLLHRFSSNEGYEAQAHLTSMFKTLRNDDTRRLFEKIVIGVITNSDDRVPGILSSFNVKVSPLRYGADIDSTGPSKMDPEPPNDIDFHCISYDVGVEKPDGLIFKAAELMLARIITTRENASPSDFQAQVDTWRKIYVGDEYVKDVEGAQNAEWNPVLLDVEHESDERIPRLEDNVAAGIDDLFKKHPVVRVHSLEKLADWLIGVAR
ncbi:unnamed protein product [Clonostachys rosea f. rosea IK726]|uniref:Haloacid dehalogenase n=2 Tax=Bionectria ochroleuca TaxID=29856 RepID=A0A0B7JVH8_BIOOC|nr:unnamed protein product [Clonostachys rosea f. rosea IK726]